MNLYKAIKNENLVPSNSAARDLIKAGGVKVNGERQTDPFHSFVYEGDIVQVGKHTTFTVTEAALAALQEGEDGSNGD